MKKMVLSHRRSRFTSIQKRISLSILFAALILISLLIGVDSNVNIGNLLKLDAAAWQIFCVSRLPRTIAIVLTASGLSVSGLIMQSLSNNKFMSPSTSGTTDAAMLGVLLSYLVLGNQTRPVQMLFAFVFAFQCYH